MRMDWDYHLFLNEIIIINDNIMHPCTILRNNLLDREDNNDDEENTTITCFPLILSYYSYIFISYQFKMF
jgi:hypothetical protein